MSSFLNVNRVCVEQEYSDFSQFYKLAEETKSKRNKHQSNIQYSYLEKHTNPNNKQQIISEMDNSVIHESNFFWTWNESSSFASTFPPTQLQQQQHLIKSVNSTKQHSSKVPLVQILEKPQKIIVDVCIRLLKAICFRVAFGISSWNSLGKRLEKQLVSLLRRTSTSYSALLICIIYLVRFKNSSFFHSAPELVSNPFLLFSTALLLALKFLTDRHISNERWIFYCGISSFGSSFDVNSAEKQFLSLISYDLYIEPQLIGQLAEMIIGKHSLE
jgi:hypothetical protein